MFCRAAFPHPVLKGMYPHMGSPTSIPPTTRRFRGMAVTAMILAFSILGVQPALAQEPDTVDEITINSTQDGLTSTLTVDFDSPVSSDEADKIKRDLATESAVQRSEPNAAAKAAPYIPTIGCGQGYYPAADKRGSMSFQMTCLPKYAVVAWGFRMSNALKASAISPVTEQGMSWWRNRVPQPRNAAHYESASYIFHGSFAKVWVNDILDYFDVLSFRSAIGGGSNIRLTIGGQLKLTY
ncbi:hypothetical protein Ae406Ps2_6424 [Pseudonocardia sp. Ae406_Ps2]|nr:hypothetical protein Ae168Ps1_6456c [Pseudonocardia sp. Ae168_Ps1]OLL69813.1 hypothetical protein Ae150APs1_6275c [Pseudonocardia sp. Ae150A_Ps1]OLL89575.1 hypothetical protein Ae406Ps2_6424 [Pseudonocardia sp. Ae406_Ps2]